MNDHTIQDLKRRIRFLRNELADYDHDPKSLAEIERDIKIVQQQITSKEK